MSKNIPKTSDAIGGVQPKAPAQAAASPVASAQPELPAEPPSPLSKIEMAACAVMGVVLVLTVWLVPRPIGDLYVAYAGARDCMDGKLGRPDSPILYVSLAGLQVPIPDSPLLYAINKMGFRIGGYDDWSFANPKQYWLDQNWGTHLLYYGTYHFFGKTGILALKALMLLLMALFIALVAREHRIGWPLAMLIAGAAMICGHAYIDLRPNLISLMFCPLMYWLLLRTREHVKRIWWAVALIFVWACMHGGFIFGLAIMGVWAVCIVVPAMFRLGFKEALRTHWPLVAAPVIAFLLSAYVTPFGIENITHPFVVGKSEAWREVAEWRPVFTPVPVEFGSSMEYFIGMGLMVGIMSLRPLVKVLRRGPEDVVGVEDMAMLLFAAVVCIAIISKGYSVDGDITKQIKDIDYSLADIKDRMASIPADQMGRALEYRDSMLSVKSKLEPLHIDILTATIIYTLLALLAVIGNVAAWGYLLSDTRRFRSFSLTKLGPVAFDLVLAWMVLMVMAFTSRRFVPLSMIVVGPLIAVQLQWLFRQLGPVRPAAVTMAAAIMLLPAGLLFNMHYKRYLRDDPLYPKQFSTMYDRMIHNELYCPDGAEFINHNNISGNTFQEWRWEGFLHWRCPQLKLFVGGRAQQAYREDVYKQRMAMWSGRTAEGRPVDVVAEMSRWKMRLAVVPLNSQSAEFLNPLLSAVDRWAIVYFDRDNIIMADGSDPDMRKLIDNIVAGKAWFPDEVIGAASRALCMTYKPLGIDKKAICEALKQANLKLPSLLIYSKYLMESPEDAVPYLLEEFERLDKIPATGNDRLRIFEARLSLADILVRAAQGPQQRKAWQDKAEQVRREYQEFLKGWQ